MAQITQHRNAKLTLAARRAMAGLMLEEGWSGSGTCSGRGTLRPTGCRVMRPSWPSGSSPATT